MERLKKIPNYGSAKVRKLSNHLLQSYLDQVYSRTSKLFLVLMPLQWIGAFIAAWIVSPFSWSGSRSELHVHVWISLLLGGALAILTMYTILTKPEKASTRHIVAISQMLFSSLFIHLSGGRIETHFHIFGSLAFLSIYRDWKVLVTATLVAVVDHALRGHYWPESVYGVYTTSNWRTLEHAAWILFEDAVLILACKKAYLELKNIAHSQALLESTKEIIEEQVVRRTRDLLESQDNLKLARDKALELSKVKTDFLANMSHEIRTPLNGIIGTIDLVMEDKLSREQFEMLQTSHRSAKSLLTIINDILDVSKMESGKFTISPTKFDIDHFMAECEGMVRPLNEGNNLTIVMSKTQQVPKYVLCDETRLRQVLLNLIGNSIKFTSRGGGILVLFDAVKRDENILELRCSVSDSGKGIDQSKQELIFEAFSQEDNTIARNYGGTGLGLAISKNIVELMGGRLWVKSREEIGSTFQFFVLTNVVDQQVAPLDQQAIPAVNPADNANFNILLAEDNLVNQKITCRLLRNRGYNVTAVINGQFALNALSEERFDLVLMDVQMPVMDGIEAIKLIRGSEKAWSNIPIIALTAHALSGDRENMLALGANGYLSKPIDKPVFFKEIAALIDSKGAASKPS